MENKFTEQKNTTSDLNELKGKYIAERVCKKWTEDFVVPESSEVVQVERRKILFEKGTEITPDVLSEINFYLSAGDIESIPYSNQCRTASELPANYKHPIYFTIILGRTKKKIIAYGDSIRGALAAVVDWLELNCKDNFGIESAKIMKAMTIIKSTIKRPEDLAQEEANEKELEENEGEEIGLKKYLLTLDMFIADELTAEHDFLVEGADIETAKFNVEQYLYKSLIDKLEGDDVKIEAFKKSWQDRTVKIIAAKEFKYDFIIDPEFCKAYDGYGFE